MTAKATTVWVPTDRVVPDPRNPNRLPEETKKKLYAAWDEGGRLIPLVVRSLELTTEFTEQRDDDKLMLLDGEQRWTYCCDRGRAEVEVSIWGGVSDMQAAHYLAVLNRLRGKDVPVKRRELVQYLAEQHEGGAEALVDMLPEKLPEILRMIEEETQQAVKNATSVAADLAMRVPLTMFVTPDQNQIIRSTIKAKLAQMDPEHQIAECRDGAALAALCLGWMEKR